MIRLIINSIKILLKSILIPLNIYNHTIKLLIYGQRLYEIFLQKVKRINPVNSCYFPDSFFNTYEILILFEIKLKKCPKTLL